MSRVSSFVALLLVCPPAWAGPPKAMVKSHAEYKWLAAESVPCGVVLEGVLRDRGFEVIERTLPESKADLVIVVQASCNPIWTGRSLLRGRHPNSSCSTQAQARGRAVRNFSMSGSDSSNTGHLQALAGACRQMAERLDRELGGKGNIDDSEVHTAAPGRQRIEVVLRWQGELSPMPLISASGFFHKAGYPAEVVQGGQQQCRFKVGFDDSREQLAHLLETYLKGRYQVHPVPSGAGELIFELAPRPE